jgi:succinate-semialdehyde dehydrogenase/glutarate-semialdehyde dehydrogenase
MTNRPEGAFGSFLCGEWHLDGPQFEVVDPATAGPIARVATIGRDEVKKALEFAAAALPAWRAATAKDRGQILHRVADELEKRKQEIARTITRENGKPLAQSMGEVGMTIDHLRWFAEEGRRAYGRIVPPQVNGKRHLIVKAPIGVVAAIAPWNFPLVLAVRKLAPALAAGCTVLLRPASQTPLCAVLLADCMQAAGVPAGVFQLVIGNAAALSDEFLENPICRKISFTGSTAVGISLIERAAKTIKPLCLELGGLAPLLVFDDCDLDVAVREAVIAKYRNTGQSCIAANRIYVQKAIYPQFLDRFCAAVAELRTGPGLEQGMDIGPLVNRAAIDGALRQIEDAQARGARLLMGGQRVAALPGYFLEPTVLADVPAEALCMKEETFAPIAPIASFETEQEAIALANGSDFGLSAYAMTRDLNRMFRLGESLEAGTIGINDGAPTTSNCPFGGVKQSGWGRELGAEGLDAFLETRHVSIGGVC